ncbi:MAG: shikimate kinase [Candidatus Brocadia sp. AMX2]|uniref:Shikimate kinase n=1 Tax=Candidatus Brocadia sinica JPN1 TaxID=1197129 RepID=A0ABQ0K1Q6_9BACT|nr:MULTISPECIES: shikimate kinase [Brocadia]KXK28999.1 MAG: shikimate kinase [Candidatus Brocadia sinica]MBC6932503.1 shikimate kinase [Candidatus Brocadia sp.]MBL1168888.1 shikimate kinase [Candidatus Brocadia sp. AMX1]NOG42765.1 shikimate kinase [Planctomycetota bacterium]KAA0245180.1 MAG: shikimate kinase [Candidatus Brocadia sp. AMX2]
MNIILIGFRGTGKTTVGKILAQRMGKEFIDADEYLEQKEGKTIKNIFAVGGEKLFREIEAQIISELCILDNKVIATGGGAILREENVRKLRKNGIIIYLDADVDTIYKRIHEDTQTQQRRPSLTNRGAYEEIEYLLAYRRPLYDRIADFVVNTAGLSKNEAAKKIIAFINNHVLDLKTTAWNC